MAPRKKTTTEPTDEGNPLDRYSQIDSTLQELLGTENYHGVQTGVDIEVEWVPSGLPSLDWVIGGGIPLGYMMTLEGPSASGKNTLTYHLCGVLQRALCKPILWVDVERRFETSWPTTCGMSCNPGLLALAKPPVGDTGKAKVFGAQGAMTVVREGAGCGEFAAVVLDSIGALIPQEQYQNDIEGSGAGRIGAKAQLMSNTLPQIASLGMNTKTTIILINQLRASNLTTPGVKSTPTGGAAAQYQPSVRLSMRRTTTIEGKRGPIGIDTQIEAVKNSLGMPFREASLRINFTRGVDVNMDIIANAVALDIVTKNGAWFLYGDFKAQGLDNFQASLEAMPDMLSRLRQEVLEKIHAN